MRPFAAEIYVVEVRFSYFNYTLTKSARVGVRFRSQSQFFYGGFNPLTQMGSTPNHDIISSSCYIQIVSVPRFIEPCFKDVVVDIANRPECIAEGGPGRVTRESGALKGQVDPIFPGIVGSWVVLVKQLQGLLGPSRSVYLREVDEHIICFCVQSSIKLSQYCISELSCAMILQHLLNIRPDYSPKLIFDTSL